MRMNRSIAATLPLLLAGCIGNTTATVTP